MLAVGNSEGDCSTPAAAVDKSFGGFFFETRGCGPIPSSGKWVASGRQVDRVRESCGCRARREAVTIVVEDYHKVYGETVAVAGINFTVGPGEILGMAGPNGAGKTT